jgi:hypothetical protein
VTDEHATDEPLTDEPLTDEPLPDAGEQAGAGPTGHPAVDDAVARLAEQAELPPAEQVPGYEAAQRALQQTLASIDQS